jgi:hypothetical protein
MQVWQYQTLEQNQKHHLETKLTLSSASFMEHAAGAQIWSVFTSTEFSLIRESFSTLMVSMFCCKVINKRELL